MNTGASPPHKREKSVSEGAGFNLASTLDKAYGRQGIMASPGEWTKAGAQFPRGDAREGWAGLAEDQLKVTLSFRRVKKKMRK